MFTYIVPILQFSVLFCRDTDLHLGSFLFPLPEGLSHFLQCRSHRDEFFQVFMSVNVCSPPFLKDIL